MRERARTIGGTLVRDLHDPFNVAVLNTSQLLDDPARLFDEANAISMLGGRRLLRIEEARDSLAPLFKDYLKNTNDQCLVVVEAGELGARSPLRMLFEKAEDAAALPCYVEEARDIAAFARSLLQEQGMTIAPDALATLSTTIAGDRMRARNEVEKLITYMGATKQITLEDVLASSGDAGAQSLDALVYAAAGRQPAMALKAYDALLAEGLPVITILRGLQQHFRRLHLTQARIQDGEPADLAMKKLSPPIFFKQEDAFRAQAQRWRLGPLGAILQRLDALEAQCKQTGVPAEILCSQALLAIASR